MLVIKHNVNIKTQDGCFPLLNASQCGHVNVVELLIEKGADINMQDKYNTTALCTAFHNSHMECSKIANRERG